jgi:hypothetical protein
MIPPLSSSSQRTIKIVGGFSVGMSANVLAIPLSAIFAKVACDLKMEKPLLSYYKEMGRKLFMQGRFREVYVGGAARTVQKIITSTANTFLPPEMTNRYPYLSRFTMGFACGFIGNPFKILQTQKIHHNARYPEAFYNLLFTAGGRQLYLKNSLGYSTTEAFRCLICFGFSAQALKKLHPEEYKSPLLQFGVCVIASSATALVESIVSFFGETVTVVHGAFMDHTRKPKRMNFRENSREVISFIREFDLLRPRYLSRCFSVVLIKNLIANMPITYGNYRVVETSKYALSHETQKGE